MRATNRARELQIEHAESQLEHANAVMTLMGHRSLPMCLRFSSYKSVLNVCKQDTRPALEFVPYAWIFSWFVGAVKNISQNRRKQFEYENVENYV